jgi:hypothetical protein
VFPKYLQLARSECQVTSSAVKNGFQRNTLYHINCTDSQYSQFEWMEIETIAAMGLALMNVYITLALIAHRFLHSTSLKGSLWCIQAYHRSGSSRAPLITGLPTQSAHRTSKACGLLLAYHVATRRFRGQYSNRSKEEFIADPFLL